LDVAASNAKDLVKFAAVVDLTGCVCTTATESLSHFRLQSEPRFELPNEFREIPECVVFRLVTKADHMKSQPMAKMDPQVNEVGR